MNEKKRQALRRFGERTAGCLVRRLRTAAFTLLAVALLTAAIAIGGLNYRGGDVPVSAGARPHFVYAIGYRAAEADFFETLANDVAYIKRRGLEIATPKTMDRLEQDGVILIVEGKCDLDRLSALLSEAGACAVPLLEGQLDAAQWAEASKLERSGLIEPAAPIGRAEDPVSLAKRIGEARLEFAARYDSSCSVFVHSCANIICTGCFKAAEALTIGRITVFTFGNGKNELPNDAASPLVFSRIIRLNDWTIEQYFDEIAA